MKAKIKITITETAHIDIDRATLDFINTNKFNIGKLFVADIFYSQGYIDKQTGTLVPCLTDKQDIGGDYSIELLSVEKTDEDYLEGYVDYIRMIRADNAYGDKFDPISFIQWKHEVESENTADPSLCSLHLPKVENPNHHNDCMCPRCISYQSYLDTSDE